MVLVQKWPFFQLFFLGNIGQENVFYDILEHLEMWSIKAHDPPPTLDTKITDRPPKQGWKLHGPPPS